MIGGFASTQLVLSSPPKEAVESFVYVKLSKFKKPSPSRNTIRYALPQVNDEKS